MPEADLKSTHHDRVVRGPFLLSHELAFDPEVPRPVPDVKVAVLVGPRGPYVSIEAGRGEELVLGLEDMDVLLDALQEARRLCGPRSNMRVLPTGTVVPLRKGAA